MYSVEIKNCNNIKEGNVTIEKNKLNIKYGINGTGKTTLARAIKFSNQDNKLQMLKSYYSDEPAKVNITPSVSNVLVFDEDFVNQVVFIQDEVIENSFEVFLKTPNYDECKKNLDAHLEALRSILYEDIEIIDFKEVLLNISKMFKRTATGKLSKTGAMKSLLSKQNLYNIPQELEVYRPFFDNSDINIPWIEWKNKGENFEVTDNCPYCSEKLNSSEHAKRSEIFKQTYTKADSQNLKEVLDLLQKLQPYLKEDKYGELITYVKTDTEGDIISAVVEKLTIEFNLLISRFDSISEFGKRNIMIADISNLEDQIAALEFPQGLFEMFGGEKLDGVLGRINDKILVLKKEATILKTEMGRLKGLLKSTVKASQNDINEFLRTAGINYELEICAEDESNSRTILRQCFTDDKTDVKDIRSHLSWGEKNAFSLILFAYYAQRQDADIIILDDPISSFDSNKKFAILHRLFKNVGKKDVCLDGKTVLLLTHDFEPIIDFIVIGKLSQEHAVATFVFNKDGRVQERVIEPKQDVCSILKQCEVIAKDSNINIVSRVAFLRKLCELNGCVDEWKNAYEILSSLIHSRDIKRKVGENIYVEMKKEEIDSGMDKIKLYIKDFDYVKLRDNVYCDSGIKSLYNVESNSYFKIQLFRAICGLSKNKFDLLPMDNGWYKFIDETYHIENDYLHYLDVLKFNIVPNYISKRVDEMMSEI